MKFSGMICHNPSTNRLDFGSDQVTKRPETTGSNCMKFSGMICHHPRISQLDLGSDEVKGQGPGQKHIFVITCSVFVRFI